jgi:HK97 family phage portal protein
MQSSQSWWPLLGSIQTSSGVAITEKSALSLSAYSCGVRVISETISSLPCHLLERKDERTWGKAVDESLYGIVHDEPNTEQDSMLFFDTQLAWMIGWGDCYAEVQRFAGEVKAVWPIHPSRIPVRNIRRNTGKVTEIHAGEPGEIVFYVNNDDGSQSPIPASSMLHIAGPLSQNGITGQGHVSFGRNALGLTQATEDHAAAFFKNGANPNMAIKSPKIVGKETADRLRQQWQTVFGGVKNHYKTVLLEDGMEPVAFTFSPQVTQLIESRQHNVVEMARLLRIPPYFLMDLQQAKFNNVESQGQDLVIFSLMPWIVRLEKGMKRQLLTPEQKKNLKFRFNVMGLLRGDQAARAAFYQAGFAMGVFSPNDIRELEDMNPVEGGDQRFVPANNLVPLTAIGEMAEATIDKMKAETEKAKEPTPAPVAPAPAETDDDEESDAAAENVAKMLEIQSQMLVLLENRDTDALSKADLTEWQAAITQLPSDFADKVGERLEVLRELQRELIDEQRAEREASELRITDLTERSNTVIVETLNATKEYAETVGPSMEKALTPLVESIQAQNKASAEQNQAILDAVEAVPSKVEFPQPPEPAPVDTSALEAVAVREAALEEKQAAIEARLAAEREASHGVLLSAIEFMIADLADWESKAIASWAETPSAFKNLRSEFYQRFVKRFESRLQPLAQQASQIGVTLDLPASADAYAISSINDLKTLDEFAADNWHDRLKEGADMLRKTLWADRVKATASGMVEQGKQRFKDENHA